jgi:hypothetical protein
LNASWKTSVMGIASILAGVANLIIAASRDGTVTTESAGIAVTAVLAGIGLLNAKDSNVSNSPHPMAQAQTVVPVSQTQPAIEPVPMAHPVPTVDIPRN